MSRHARPDQLARMAQQEADARAKQHAEILSQRRQILNMAFEHEQLCVAFLERAVALLEGAASEEATERFTLFVEEGKARVAGAREFVCMVIDDVVFSRTPVNPGQAPEIVAPTPAETVGLCAPAIEGA